MAGLGWSLLEGFQPHSIIWIVWVTLHMAPGGGGEHLSSRSVIDELLCFQAAERIGLFICSSFCYHGHEQLSLWNLTSILGFDLNFAPWPHRLHSSFCFHSPDCLIQKTGRHSWLGPRSSWDLMMHRENPVLSFPDYVLLMSFPFTGTVGLGMKPNRLRASLSASVHLPSLVCPHSPPSAPSFCHTELRLRLPYSLHRPSTVSFLWPGMSPLSSLG